MREYIKKIPQSSAWYTVVIITATTTATIAPLPLPMEALIAYLEILLLCFNGVTPAFVK